MEKRKKHILKNNRKNKFSILLCMIKIQTQKGSKGYENLNDAIFLIARFHEMIAQSGAEYVDIAYNSSTDGELVHLSVLEFELQ